MRNKFKPLILFALILIMAISCEEDNPKIDPKVAILGKWETIEIGTPGNMIQIEPSGFVEFLPDSIYKSFDYEEQKLIFQCKYWIDSLLHFSQFIDIDLEVVNSYKFEFSENYNKLQLDDVGNWDGMFTRSILKRIE